MTAPPPSPPETPPWHALAAGEAALRLATSDAGLSDEEAAARLARHGPNLLPAAHRAGPLARFAAQFRNVLIYVLLASAAIALALGEALDAAVILGVVLINAVIGFVQEGRAERSLDAIRGLLTARAAVRRGGRRLGVPAETIVPGDMVLLEAGDRVPADLRLVRARNLQVQEGALTGESLPAEKHARAAPAGAALGDRTSMAYSGTLVVAGSARGIAVATGAATEIGRIGALLAGVETLSTPLLRRLADFGRTLTAAILMLAAATFLVGTLAHGWPLADTFMGAVGIAVAAIPEGLPAIVTIALAIGVQRMARRRAIVRRLPAVEALGSVTVICTDKTGTLTRNEMAVEAVCLPSRMLAVTGAGYAPEGAILQEGRPLDASDAVDVLDLARACALCNDADVRLHGDTWLPEGDPTEAALVAFARKAGLETAAERAAHPRADAVPFDSAARYMATLHGGGDDGEGGALLVVKGAPERVLRMCPGADRDAWHGAAEGFAARGLRVLAVAARPMPAEARTLDRADVEGGLTMLGLVGLGDPPRPEAVAAVARCRAAGIAVKMITGDHAATAQAIGRALGLGNTERVLTGNDLDALDGADLAAAAMAVDVFARTSPEHKLRLVEALQAAGQQVAMTGDGVNDAPALKRADVGVAMGHKGTDAAREAAQVVLADDNFATIAAAVEEGRTIYDNIRKAILFTLPTNGGEALAVAAAILLGIALPITPLQILWINMVTEVTLSLALAFERAEDNVMARPPRPVGEPLLSGFLLWRIAAVTALMVAGTFGVFLWQVDAGAGEAAARTAAVNALVLFEIVYLFNARTAAPAFGRRALAGLGPALAASGLVLGLQIVLTYVPAMQALFETAALPAGTWIVLAALALAFGLIVEAEKALLRRTGRRNATA